MIRRLTSSMRPFTTSLPRSMMATDVQNSSISERMCDEINTVRFPSSARRCMMFLSSIRPCGSTPLAGSSSRSTRGLGMSVLASISRCRMPRDSSTTSDWRFSESPTISRWRSTSMRPAGAGSAVACGEEVEELPDK